MQSDSFVQFREWLLANDYTNTSAYQMETLCRGLHNKGAQVDDPESLEKALPQYAASTWKHRRSAWRAYVRWATGKEPVQRAIAPRKTQHRGRPITYQGVDYPSLSALALAHGVNPTAFFNRRSRGETLENALRPLEKTGRPSHLK